MTESPLRYGSSLPWDSEASPFMSKASYIAQEIRRQILDGTLTPGAELRQRDLAEMFKVSPTPVREALSRLSSEGYVTTRLHRGATVVRPALERRQENWRIRASLEALATELATERATPADLDEIGKLAGRFANASEADSRWTANMDFHFRIYEAAGSPVLLRFIQQLWQALDVAPNAYRSHEHSVAQHYEILSAMRAGDAERASELTRLHISTTASAQEES